MIRPTLRFALVLCLFAANLAVSKEVDSNEVVGAGVGAVGLGGGIWMLNRTSQSWVGKRFSTALRTFNRASMQIEASARDSCILALGRVSGMTAPPGSQAKHYNYGRTQANLGEGGRSQYDFSPQFLARSHDIAHRLSENIRLNGDEESIVALQHEFFAAIDEENIIYMSHFRVPAELHPREGRFHQGQYQTLQAKVSFWNDKLRANKNLFKRFAGDGRDVTRLVGVGTFGMIFLVGGQMVVLGWNQDKDDALSALKSIPNLPVETLTSATEIWKNIHDTFSPPPAAKNEVAPEVVEPKKGVATPPPAPTPPPKPRINNNFLYTEEK